MVCKEVILKDGTKKIYNYSTYKDYNNNYYQQNKNKILQPIICECGGRHHKLNRTTHIKTKKHIKYLENKNI